MAVDLSIPLEELILTKLTALDLRNDEDVVNFAKEVVEETAFEQEDRKSAILGMLEIDEDDEKGSAAVEELLEETQAYQDTVEARRLAEEHEAKEKAEAEAAAVQGKSSKVLSPEEEERRKAALLRQYGRVEEESDADRIAREEAERPPDKALLDPSQMNKKQRKKALNGVDLLALPNMNKAHVAAKQQASRSSDAAKAQAKREKDKADLKKQKDDAAKKLADKQKRAQKGERRA
ncbi:hypothetical protein JCM11641_005249 [Rhodosporidiobolus odoratus]